MYAYGFNHFEHLNNQCQQLQQENVFFQTCITNQQTEIQQLKCKLKEQEKSTKKRKPLAPLDANVEDPKPKRNLKRYFDLSHSERASRSRQMEATFNNAASSLNDDVVSVKVELEFDNGKKKSFSPLSKQNEEGSDQLRYEKKLNDKSLVQKVLVVKDRYRISDDALHELHMLNSVIPSKNKIVEERKRLNSVLPIYVHPGVRLLVNN